MRARWLSGASVSIALATVVAPVLAEGGLRPEDLAFFENEVRPLLVERCYGCHSASAEKLRAEFRLDSGPAILRGGERGPAVVPGDPDASLLIHAVRWDDPDLHMPPRDKLPERAIRTLERWVELGAPDPRSEEPERAPTEAEDIASSPPGADHWIWKRPSEPPIPSVRNATWPRAGLDRFILARLEAAGLDPSPEADRRTWLRRVNFDLAGLPPSPEDLQAFLADDSPNAYEKVVDRLLASPSFGECWGTHWLDLVRFAETHGHEQDFPIPEAWRYRDYVIRALNADVPYDTLLTEHIAGDLVEEPRIDPFLHTNESVQGTGFWHLGEATHSPVDIRGEEADRVANQIDVFGRAFQGLAFGCARCHDHKFDPIRAEDYYALFGYLQSSSFFLANVADPERNDRIVAELHKARAEHEPRIAESWARLWLDRTRNLADRLLAGAGQESGLDGEITQRWRAELDRATRDITHPLWLFATLASSSATDPASRIRAALTRLESEERRSAVEAAARVVERTVEKGERNYVTVARPAEDRDVVIDYGSASSADWYSGDRAFGDGPRRPGELRLGRTQDEPVVRVIEHGEASVEPLSAFQGLLRTPTFEVTSNTLWYRYRGAADVFLAVDSHRVVAGPLHSSVKQSLADSKGEIRWQAHRVSDYIGHRVHVEFTPRSPDFALLEVRFAKDEPAAPRRANRRAVVALARLDALASTASIADLAEATANVFRAALRDLAAGELESTPPDDACDAARLVNWLLAHEALFDESPEGASARTELAERTSRWLTRRAALEAEIPAPIPALSLLDGSGENEPVHIRGNHRTLASMPVERHYLSAIPFSTRRAAPEHGSGRLELARDLVSLENPLTLRVIVNRVWHWLLGRGIVASVDDFGRMGELPTHPELLDWLALHFAKNGWSIKKLVREIVLSSTYRQSSHPRPEASAIDPRNHLWHRMDVRRLSAEAIRDSLLAVSGRLELRIFGPSVPVHITPFMRGNRSPSGGPADGNGRRSIYIEVRRNHLSHFLTAFDRPVPFATIGRRNVSNSPVQPLMLLNDPFVHDEARKWAERLLRDDLSDRLERLWLEAFSRLPSDRERDAAKRFLADSEMEGASPKDAWAALCHTVVNVKEFTYLD